MATANLAITQTLTAATATDDTITGIYPFIEIINHASKSSNHVVYVSIGATAPTVAGNDFIPVLAEERIRFGAQRGTAGTRVRMISANNPVVTIRGLNG